VPSDRASDLLRHLRSLAVRPGTSGVPDGRLLADFVQRRDEAAFTELVRRHGPMVLAVCRSILANTHDAEDAFQATFLLLARKAAQSASPWGGARTRPVRRSPAGPRTAQHFVHFSKMVSILRPGEELLSERCPIWSKPADGQNTSQSADAIPETGG
jgi:hypothetical protein